ncbi:MAG: HAD-IA family hydrolase [Chloroflexota bacterium]|nr:HAD-IA family hydrolase [Chloroflexota bacterium]MDE2897328.1 HAD-IA family hydrolase [Chloroflexota bacterium]
MNPATQSYRSLCGPYQTVFVDIGGTVVHIEPPFFETVLRIAAEFGVPNPPDDFEQRADRVWRQDGEENRSRGCTLTTSASSNYWQSQYVRLGEVLGIHDTAGFGHVLYERFSSFEAYQPMPGAVDALRALNRLGLRLVVASNWEGWLGRLLALLDLERFFAAQVVSADIGAEKPDRLFFERGLAIAQASRRRVLHVGDNPDADVNGALNAEIDAVWVNPSVPADSPVPVIASIANLPDLIRPHVAPPPWPLA